LIQEREFFPLGSDSSRNLEARLVFATHADLDAMLASGALRKDLYYRLCTHRVHLPPLRERKGDLPLLLEHFLSKAAREIGREVPGLEPDVIELLMRYGFPGNVRELEALVYDLVSNHREGKPISRKAFAKRLSPEALTAAQVPGQATTEYLDFPVALPTIDEMTDKLVAEAMRRAGNKQVVACRMLGISQPALSKRIKRMKAQNKL
jgi:transcriptional regulator with PAS, ATPase and Fis domain